MAPRSAPLIAELLAGDLAISPDSVAERILDAAYEQILSFGLRRTTVEDVGRRAGLSRVTIYRRFPNKDAMVRALFMRELRRFISSLDAAAKSKNTVEEKLIEGFAVAVKTARDHPLIGRLLATDPEVLLPYLTVHAGPALALARDFLARRIRQAQKLGAAPGIDADPAAEVLVRLALSFVLVTDSGIALDDDRQIRAFARRYIAPFVTGTPAWGSRKTDRTRASVPSTLAGHGPRRKAFSAIKISSQKRRRTNSNSGQPRTIASP